MQGEAVSISLSAGKSLIPLQKGTITHEYNFITAFAAKVPSDMLHLIKTMGEKYNVVIEQDQEISINSES